MGRRHPSWMVIVAIALAWRASAEIVGTGTVTSEELLVGAVLGLPVDPPGLVSADDVLRVSPEMRQFLDDKVDRRSAPLLRLHQLTMAIIGRRTFGLRFDTVTRTASETFRLRTGNCLSFSNMFVALAREVGLDASFQEVDIPPDWSLQNDVFVLNRHVNVRVDLGSGGERVVDFNIDDFRASYSSRRISESRAMAHYFNNIGVERMQAGDPASALCLFRRAIADGDRRFSPAWTNLGTLYARLGHDAHAEAAYLQALKVDRGDLVAMSNLAGLYERLGIPERAATYRKKVEEHRRRNPYFRFQRALEACDAGEWDTAIDHLKFAVRRKRNEGEFCALLARCYAQKGNQRAAQRWLARAERVAVSDSQRQRYAEGLGNLLAPSSSWP